MVEQLVFSLVDEEPPAFANFVAGSNAEAVSILQAIARGDRHDTLLLWGAEGTGKSHLLRAFVAALGAGGRRARYYASADDVADDDGADAVAVDDVDTASAAAQGRLFTLFNAMRSRGGAFVAAAHRAPAHSELRDDLRTRLGWGITLEIRHLSDADKPAALVAYARQRGFDIGDDVVAWLLAHGRRDMRSLTATLAALDHYALAQRRSITVALVREWQIRNGVPHQG